LTRGQCVANRYHGIETRTRYRRRRSSP
jgi:hypothetical protein